MQPAALRPASNLVGSFEIRRIGLDRDPPPAAQAREDSARHNPYSAQFYQDRPAPANDDDGPAPTFAELSHLDELCELVGCLHWLGLPGVTRATV
jgi:hypothetical protein